MYNAIELIEKIKKGAEGDVLAAVDVCKTIVDEKIFQLVPAQSFAPVPRSNDKGHRMKAARGGPCKVCNKNIEIGEDIYFKKFFGASHAACIDVDFLTEIKKIDEPVPF